MTFCEECQTEVVRCEHIAHEQKLKKIAEIEAQWESDPQYLCKELDRQRPSVDTEDESLWGTYKYKEACLRWDRLQERHHQLTRSNSCDCHLCKEKGWYIPLLAASKPAMKSALAAFLNGDDSNCHCGCRCQVCREGGCGGTGGWGCICAVCMDEYERRAFGRRFYVIDGMGALVVRARELEEFLADYPNAREIK